MQYLADEGTVIYSAKDGNNRKVFDAPGCLAVKDDLVNAGAVFVDEPAVVDGNIISSRIPDDLTEFCRAIITAMI